MSLAVAPVAMISASVRKASSSVRMVNGRRARSTSTAAWNFTWAPKRLAWARILSISSGPRMPSGKPGKFSTSVVMVSWPPGWSPSSTSGARSARAA
jgi:hypothetical protein